MNISLVKKLVKKRVIWSITDRVKIVRSKKPVYAKSKGVVFKSGRFGTSHMYL